MTEVTNLTALRNLPITTDTVYVQGYDNPGDGGGGFFLWRDEPIFQTGVYSIENFGTIIKSDPIIIPNDQGSWIRQYDGFINVLYFGALGYGNDYTAAFQKAIDFASLNSKIYPSTPSLKGSTVFIPNGSYFISNIILKNGITILGESIASTLLYATEGTEDQYMFEMERGLVMINISNLYLSGQKSQRGAFHFKSAFPLETPLLGGLQNSKISNINIFGFYGHGINLEGGGQNSKYLLPHQFNVFENVRVFNFSEYNNSLQITGENGQLTFLNCEFDGNPKKDENDVYTFKKGVNILIRNVKQYNPAVISFINCTCQYADYGFMIEWAENITIDNCWFEELGVAISVKSNLQDKNNDNPSRSINILNNRFINASGFGSLNAPNNNIKDGQCINISKSFVNVNNNYVGVTTPEGQFLSKKSAFIIAYNNPIGGVSAQGNTFSVNKLGRTFGIMQKILINFDDSIDCSGHKLIFINQEETDTNPYPNPNIRIINSSINAGEYLTFRADQGMVRFYNTENIIFSTLNPDGFFDIYNGQIVTFVKIDNTITTNPIYPLPFPPTTYYSTYQLVSIMREVI